MWALHDGYFPELNAERHSYLIAVLSRILQKKKPQENQGIMLSNVIQNMHTDDVTQACLFADSVLEAKYSFRPAPEDAEIARVLREKKESHQADKALKDEKTKEARIQCGAGI